MYNYKQDMSNPSLINTMKKSFIPALFAICVFSFAFAQEPDYDIISPDNLSDVQRQARDYRVQGAEMQRMGNLDGALSLYEKAKGLDPTYAVAYNDAGVIYESKGLTEQAEANYLKSIDIDPTYLSAYSNAASLYETKRDLDQAAYYWKKRIELGFPDDPWTIKAREKLTNLSTHMPYSKEEDMDKLTELQRQARDYRVQGAEMQRMGNLDGALSLYEKAKGLDPTYAVAYNDAGVIYESKGLTEQAEANYLKSIDIDPTYLSAYSNAASLYETKRDLDQAAYYWKKRAELGSPDDPWTVKAQKRAADIAMVSGKSGSRSKEKAVLNLLKDIENEKAEARGDNTKQSKLYFDKAKMHYEKGDEKTALKEAINAKQLDPKNTEINEFIAKVQTRVLTQ